MYYEIDKVEDKVYVLKMDKLINEYEFRELKEEVEELLLDDEGLTFIVDMKTLKYLNSSGLNFLIRLLTMSRNHDGDTLVINVSDQILNLLIITKIKSLFSFFNSMEDALEYIANAKSALS